MHCQEGVKLRIGNIRIRLTKIFFFIFFFYVVIISNRWLYISRMTSILLFATVGCAFLEYKKYMRFAMGMYGLFAWSLLFLVLNLLFSCVTAVDLSQSYSAFSRYVQYLILMLVCILIGIDDGNLNYFCVLLITLAITMVVLIYTQPVIYFASSDYTIYLTISETASPHVVGIYILFGLWALLYGLPRYKPGFMTTILLMILMVVMVGAIFLTNSRKSLVGVAILVIFSFRPLVLFMRQSLSSQKRVFISLCIGIAVIAVLVWVSTTELLQSNNMVSRLTVGVNEESNSTRLNLISEAFDVFLKHPIFGVGMDNYRYYSLQGIYSHNTYVELMACCGLLGGLPFICFVGKMIMVLLSRRFKKLVQTSKRGSYHHRMIIAMMILLLYIGFMQIMFYERTLMFALSVIVTYIIMTTCWANVNQSNR